MNSKNDTVQEIDDDYIEFRSLIFSDSLVLYITMCFMMLIALFSLDRGPMVQGISIITIISILIVITSMFLVFKKLLFEVYDRS